MELHEECGVFGVWAPQRDVARLTYFALHALQHRGQDSAGIAVGDGQTVLIRKDLGLVTEVFTNSDLDAMPGKAAVGHCRYGTAGAKGWEAAQPHLSSIDETIIAWHTMARWSILMRYEKSWQFEIFPSAPIPTLRLRRSSLGISRKRRIAFARELRRQCAL